MTLTINFTCQIECNENFVFLTFPNNPYRMHMFRECILQLASLFSSRQSNDVSTFVRSGRTNKFINKIPRKQGAKTTQTYIRTL